MILADVDIMKLIENDNLRISPFDIQNLRPNGVRVHISNEIITYDRNQTIDMSKPEKLRYTTNIIDPVAGFILSPNEFILMSTLETIKTPRDIVGYLEGRSTIARLGLSIHCTSGIIDNLYEEPRSIILEIKNNGPLSIKLYPGLPIGMMLFHQLSSPVEQDVQKQYFRQDKVTVPNLEFIHEGGGKIEK
ncbi:dCTP deaminase [Paenibacillus tundrae]|uniref:dCTP deaminase n=1 Tax=Paenibacillus tundrae TaxID=528187 RepID=A0ABT9WJD2_9BACL|nr:dCTP deaminase [Paenibacillus tundrae]MDQ0173376.1 dCTP deaminase [Paenibacillus tundrae]